MKCLLPYCNDECAKNGFCTRHLRKQVDCWLPYCDKKRAESNDGLLEHCSLSHYNEAMMCWLPCCSNPRRRYENNDGFHICCSISHNKAALCSLVGCKNYRTIINERGNKILLAYCCSQHHDLDNSIRSDLYQHKQPVSPQPFFKSGESSRL